MYKQNISNTQALLFTSYLTPLASNLLCIHFHYLIRCWYLRRCRCFLHLYGCAQKVCVIRPTVEAKLSKAPATKLHATDSRLLLAYLVDEPQLQKLDCPVALECDATSFFVVPYSSPMNLGWYGCFVPRQEIWERDCHHCCCDWDHLSTVALDRTW